MSTDTTISTEARALRLLAQTAALAVGYSGGTLETMRAPPGKFEAEPYYVPHFYDLMLNGAESQTLYDGDTPIAVFDVDADERAAFGFEPSTVAVALWETDTGFCMFAEWTAAQLEEAEQIDGDSFAEDFDL